MQWPGGACTRIQRVFRSTSLVSRLVGGVAVLGLVIVGALVLRSSNARLVSLTGESEFSVSELAAMQAQLDQAGIAGVELRNGQLMVPEPERDRCCEMIREVEPSRTWAETWEEANLALGHFSMSAQREDAKEITRAKLISRYLNELPGVDQADVVWDEEQQPGWNRAPRVRATVYLKPEPGQRISLDTVHAVRLAVAGGKAYLDPENVVVLDLGRMVAFDREALGADFAAQYGQITRLTTQYRQRTEALLSDIPGASVAVRVEPGSDAGLVGGSLSFPPPQSEPESGSPHPEQTAGAPQGGPNVGLQVSREPPPEASVRAASPGSARSMNGTDSAVSNPRHQVHVSVSIPTSHYRQIGAARQILPAAKLAEARQILAEIEQEVIADVRNRLTQLQAADDPAGQSIVLVQTIHDDEDAQELFLPHTAPAPLFSASVLSRSRGALTFMTLLVAAWLIWTLTRKRVRSNRSRNSIAISESPQSDSVGNGQIPAPSAPVATGAATLLSGVSADQLSEVLNANDRDVVARRLHRSADPPADAVPDMIRPATADVTSRQRKSTRPMNCQTTDVDQWDIDELAELPDAQLRKLVRSVAIDTWPAALWSAAPTTRRRLLSALPDGESAQLREVLDQVRPVRLHEIDLARQEILSALSTC